MLIALDIVAGLESAGVEVTGPIGTVDEALRIIDSASFDAVCSMPICVTLQRR